MTHKTIDKRQVKWVAHRGYAEVYPENTAMALLGALEQNAHAVEFDLQLSKDLVPVLLHDANLLRTAGIDAEVSQLTLSSLEQISVHEPERFGERHAPCYLSSLAAVVPALAAWQDKLFFVEVKKDCFDQLSHADLYATLANILAPIRDRVVMISYDLDWVKLVKSHGWRNGWVLTQFDEASRLTQQENVFDFCICNIKKIIDAGRPPWQGPWHWFVYDVRDEQTLETCLSLGIEWIETWDVKSMMALTHV